jgi:hypothetical protein
MLNLQRYLDGLISGLDGIGLWFGVANVRTVLVLDLTL